MINKSIRIGLLLLLVCTFVISGCSTIQKPKSKSSLVSEIRSLEAQVDDLQKENEQLRDGQGIEAKRLTQAERELLALKEDRDRKLSELEEARRELEKSLAGELGDSQTTVEMTDRGLVLTFVAEVFFDSGKAEIKKMAEPTLKKVADVINTNVPELLIAIEGHTDNDPIKHSGWKSNWELASARALAVTHYFIDKGGVDPTRLSANSYGEYSPLADNKDKKGRQLNRRVEVVILPPNIVRLK